MFEAKSAATFLLKLEKGFHEAKHKHPSDAFLMVLEGRLVDGVDFRARI